MQIDFGTNGQQVNNQSLPSFANTKPSAPTENKKSDPFDFGLFGGDGSKKQE